MKIREFLRNYAEKFPEQIPDIESFVNTTNNITIDYADGVFSFYEKSFKQSLDNPANWVPAYRLTGAGGHNGCILEDEDYYYLWDNFIGACPKFNEWYVKHGLGHQDFMVIDVNFNNTAVEELGRQEVEASFVFYEGMEDDI